MRLKKLWIKEFKNLKDFSIEFSTFSTSILIGRNGTGKSNLFEAIVLIFKNLDLSKNPEFEYKIEYLIRGHEVKVDALPGRAGHSVVYINGKKVPFSKFTKGTPRTYLPKHVFAYYSGPSNRLEAHFDEHQRKFDKDLRERKERPLRPLFYARPIHSNFVLISFFSFFDDEIQASLRKHLLIEGLQSVLFVLKSPYWGKQKREHLDGDERFWYSRGIVKDFLGDLYKLALAPIYNDEKNKIDFNRDENEERLYLYLQDEATLALLAKKYNNNTEFFKILESTYIADLIREVRIKVRIKGIEQDITFKELSEGEQQLLTVLGLLRFTNEDESLFLLDEPDTHLNPFWKWKYLDFLDEFVGKQEKSQVIMCTHDPLVIGGLGKSQVRILERQNGKIQSLEPDHDPKGMGVAALLTSELFGLRSTLDIETLEKLDRKRELSTKEGTLTAKDRKELEKLNEELEHLDYTTTVRDPLYKLFVHAMYQSSEYEEYKAPVLTKDQKEKALELAKKIFKEIETKKK